MQRRGLLKFGTCVRVYEEEAHPKLKPVDAPTRGVYFAGCVESPKDIKDSVTQSGAAAARARPRRPNNRLAVLLPAGTIRRGLVTSKPPLIKCTP